MKIYDIAFVGMGASALGTYKLKYHNQDCSIIGIDKNFNITRFDFFLLRTDITIRAEYRRNRAPKRQKWPDIDQI